MKSYSDSFHSRQRAQVDAFERVAKKRAEAGARAFVVKCAADWEAWERDGYAEAFAQAWKEGVRDPEALCALAISGATSIRACKALDRVVR